GMSFQSMSVELEVAAEEEPLRDSTTPSTTPTITTIATMPPITHQRRSTPRAAGAPFERTGAGFREGGGPRPCFRRVDAFAIGAQRYQRRVSEPGPGVQDRRQIRWIHGFVGSGFFVVRLRPTRALAFVGPMVIGALILLVLVVVAAAALLPRMLRGELGALREHAAQELSARNADVDRRLQSVVETMDRRLDSAQQTSARIHERLGEVTKATAEMNERAKELGRLEQALRPPKARGGFGELLL